MPPDPLGLAAENAVLRAALAEARESIEGWSAYASEYFQDRWDLEGDLARVDAALATPSPAAEAVREVVRAAIAFWHNHDPEDEVSHFEGKLYDKTIRLEQDFPALAAGISERRTR